MKPHDGYGNGDDDGASDSESGSESGEPEVWVEDPEAPARALSALNALRKSRQHYDVVLVAAGTEVPAHRALLAAASPYLLASLGTPAPPASPAPLGPEPAAYNVQGVPAPVLKELVEYMYTGRLRARDAEAARALYRGAWRLRLEAARGALGERLARRPQPLDVLHTRALPDLPPRLKASLDTYIAEHFDEMCEGGALAALPLVRMEMLRASSSLGGEEEPLAVAHAALAWLRSHDTHDSLEELCSRAHVVYVDSGGALRDCGELPAASGDAPELLQYKRRHAPRPAPAPAPAPAPPRARLAHQDQLGERSPTDDCAVLAARGAQPTQQGGCRVTRALVWVRGAVVAARVAWRDGADVCVGGPLGGREPAGPLRAPLAHPRTAHGAAVLGSRLIVCGGYDRARALRSVEAYSAADNEWRPLAPLTTARARFPAAALQGRLYVCGGSDGHTELDSLDVYIEERNEWERLAKLERGVSHAALCADSERSQLWVVGGWAMGRELKATHIYRPDTGSLHPGPSLHTGRSQCAGVVWEGRLWALGGCDTWHCLASTETLDLADPSAQWTPGIPLSTARRSMGGCVWRGRLVLCGGSDGANSLRRVEWLSPGAGCTEAEAGGAGGAGWRGGPELRRARAALTLSVLDGVLYAVAGFDGKEFLSCVECLYEPDGEWTSLCSPPAPQPAVSPSPSPSPSPYPAPATAEAPTEKEPCLENGKEEVAAQ